MTEATEKAVKPDFKKMSNAELLVAYNEIVAEPRKSKFKNAEEGVIKCNEAWKEKQKSDRKAAKGDGAEGAATERRPRASDDDVIELIVTDNPRREGTDAHMHFEKMRGGVTIGKYLSKFEDKKKARAWLSNTIRDEYVKIVPATAKATKAAKAA